MLARLFELGRSGAGGTGFHLTSIPKSERPELVFEPGNNRATRYARNDREGFPQPFLKPADKESYQLPVEI
jgi:hypothetical protein